MGTQHFFRFVFIAAAFVFVPAWMAFAQPSKVFKPGNPTPPGQASASVEGVSMGMPRLAGNGCPSGSASTALSPDGKALSIIFDRFVAELGEGRRRRMLLNCTLHVPFSVPHDRQMAVIRLDYRGFNFLPPAGRSELRAWYSYVGPGSPVRGRPTQHYRVFTGPSTDLYFLSSETEGLIWSKCGRKFQLVSHTQLAAETNQSGESLISTVDSMDSLVDENVVYHLAWRRCR